MSIEIRISGSNENSHQENKKIKYFAYCYSCWSVNEENGDYGQPPLEMNWIPENATLKEIVFECEKHEPGKEHRIVISGVVRDS